jgi:hypothetical protein
MFLYAFLAKAGRWIFTEFFVQATDVSGSFFRVATPLGCFSFMTDRRNFIINSDVSTYVEENVMACN